MKNQLPPHPHTAEIRTFQNATGQTVQLIAVQFLVSSRIAALLPSDPGGTVYHIASAGIGDETHLKQRAGNWRAGQRTGFSTYVCPGKDNFIAAIEEGCDTPIRVGLTAQEWALVGMLCGALGITPGQWFLACAFYNARIEEKIIDQSLADLPPLPIEPKPRKPRRKKNADPAE